MNRGSPRKPLSDSNSQCVQGRLGDVVDDAFQFSQIINSNMNKETIAIIVAILDEHPEISPESLTYIVNELREAVIRRRDRRRNCFPKTV